jgi:transposase
MLVDQIDALGGQIATLTARIEQLLAAIPAGQGSTPTAPLARVLAAARTRWCCPPPPGWMRSPASGRHCPGRHRRDRAGHGGLPDAWAAGVMGQAEPRTCSPEPPPRRHHRQGQPSLKGVLGEAAAAAAKTDTFLGERYRRLVKRIGKRKAWSPSPARSW